ncbi:hypothetical protein DENSPDRAFT_841153 [Dentipellis sp. KUC8613]|nr:hypothetical protein DENSPDRAFT_841153 [Dentipellis sp. KUC8613]
MTRTERATSPRALLKDRSEAKNGMDASIRKGGAGAHNWGSLDDEARLEDEADLDEEQAFEDDNSQYSYSLICGAQVVLTTLSQVDQPMPMSRRGLT